MAEAHRESKEKWMRTERAAGVRIARHNLIPASTCRCATKNATGMEPGTHPFERTIVFPDPETSSSRFEAFPASHLEDLGGFDTASPDKLKLGGSPYLWVKRFPVGFLSDSAVTPRARPFHRPGK